jgi:hypothetical protein
MEMSRANISEIGQDAVFLGGKSWSAYVGTIAIGFVAAIFTAGMATAYSATTVAIFAVVWIAYVAYKILSISSYCLYYDSVGVWVSSGVLPWQKGVSGVKWRDLDEAVYFKSMGSWLLKSYGIRIGHRFTKTSEIVLTSWADGNQVVARINAKHHELVIAGGL